MIEFNMKKTNKTKPYSMVATLAVVTRPKFLFLALACVLPGIATAFNQTERLQWIDVLLVTLGAVATHIAVNVLNEYHDFQSGLDFISRKTPFSGGSGMLPVRPEAAPAALALALSALLFSALIGVYFTVVSGPLIWIPAIFGLIVIVTYTKYLNQRPLLCLIAPGLGFGTCMVLGTHYALSKTFSVQALGASLIPFFLVNNLLLLNQFPDVEADRQIGRRHYPIVIGRSRSAIIFLLFWVAAYVAIILCVLMRIFSPGALLGLLTLPVAILMQIGVFRNADNIDGLIPYMGLNVLVTLMTPSLMAIGMLLL